MRKILLIGFLSLLRFGVNAQEIPNIKLSTLEGQDFQTQQLNELKDKPVVLSFWATWCIPCINELTAINEDFDNWNKELKFEFYAISEDDSRTAKRVQPLVNGKGWSFNILLDKNQNLKRELNIANIPYTLVIKNGKIIYRHAGYVAGNEQELYQVIKENQ
ncbi:MAG TPA: TlpA disulfide reductase family protein [Chitinophagaceae bacterium]|nr:TlpA disulfide reductase family protein [Chitinophagaceae bacterium]